MKALKVRSRDLCRMAGAGANMQEAMGKQYVTVHNACDKGAVLIDGELYVRYAPVVVPVNTKRRRLQTLADYIDAKFSFKDRYVDPVQQAMGCDIVLLTPTVEMSESQYALYMLGVDPDHPAVRPGMVREVVEALRAEAATCQS